MTLTELWRMRDGTLNSGPSFYVTDNAALSPDAIAALLARIRHN